MHHPEAHELGLGKARDHLQNPPLFAPFQIGLETHQVPQPPVLVFLPQLHDGVGPSGPPHIAVIHITPAWIPQSDRLERPITHGVLTAPGQLFNRQTTFKKGGVLFVEVLELGLFRLQQGLTKRKVLLPVHWTVDVVRIALVVSTGAEGDRQINAVAVDDRAGGIKKMTIRPSGEATQILRQGFAGERTGCQHRDRVLMREGSLFFAFNRHQGMAIKRFGEGSAVTTAIHREGTTRGNGMSISCSDHQGPQPPQLLLQQACSPITAERTEAVAADQFSKVAAVVSR